uniref:Cas1p 10 TM acyl transferase domain-containing protein n=1 Tax=Xenopus tropicalis TaxID=8364 RepID=B5DE19_XENTR|nr:Unknown (protein for MGC:173009) [Xenopus tropicalis]
MASRSQQLHEASLPVSERKCYSKAYDGHSRCCHVVDKDKQWKPWISCPVQSKHDCHCTCFGNLAEVSEVYWFLQDPVYEPSLSESRKMITNNRIDAYNDIAAGILNGTIRKSKVKIFSVSRLISEEIISESLDGLHLPEPSKDISAMILMNAFCNKIVNPIDGSCCQPTPSLTIIQKLAACFFIFAMIAFVSVTIVQRNKHRRNKQCDDIESGEEKKPATATPAASSLEILLFSLSKLGLIMAYFYFCDRANLFMKENKFYTHSSFFIPIIYILVLGVFYNENTKEAKLLNREQTDEWKGWMQLVILIYHISGASSFFASVHARSSSGRCLPIPDRLWTLFLFLA